MTPRARRRLIPRTAGATAVACLALLAGCVAAPTPSDPPSAAPEPSSSASPPPSATPSADESDDPADWVIDFGRVGPIDVGGSLAEERQGLVTFTETTDIANCPTVAAFESEDAATVWLPLDETADVIGQVLLTRYRADGDQIAQPTAPTTELGIGIGSPEADLVAAYPDIEPPSDDVSIAYTLSDGAGGFIHFTVAEGAVSEIAVSAVPEPSYEVCA